MGDYNVQYVDANISHVYFNKLADDTLLVKKVWLTIQGEGPFAGCPAVFVRLAGCNRGAKLGMGCEFCDTDFRMEGSQAFRVGRLAERVRDIRGKAELVVITGGEPMLQPALIPFIEALMPGVSMQVQIESNGDRLLPGFKSDESVTLVVSPKVSGSVTPRYLPLKEEVAAAADCLKFLVDHRQASPYYDVPSYADEWLERERGTVCISPIAVYKKVVAPGEVASAWDMGLIDVSLTRKNYAHAAALAVQRGFTVSIQQHLFLEAE